MCDLLQGSNKWLNIQAQLASYKMFTLFSETCHVQSDMIPIRNVYCFKKDIVSLPCSVARKYLVYVGIEVDGQCFIDVFGSRYTARIDIVCSQADIEEQMEQLKQYYGLPDDICLELPKSGDVIDFVHKTELSDGQFGRDPFWIRKSDESNELVLMQVNSHKIRTFWPDSADTKACLRPVFRLRQGDFVGHIDADGYPDEATLNRIQQLLNVGKK